MALKRATSFRTEHDLEFSVRIFESDGATKAMVSGPCLFCVNFGREIFGCPQSSLVDKLLDYRNRYHNAGVGISAVDVSSREFLEGSAGCVWSLHNLQGRLEGDSRLVLLSARVFLVVSHQHIPAPQLWKANSRLSSERRTLTEYH